MKTLLTLFAAALLLYGCNSRQHGNPHVSGRWYYAGAPQSYLEFDGSTCTEHLGEANSEITYSVSWDDSLHYELEVKEVEGPADQMFAPGDKLQVEVKEVTMDYYRFYISGKGEPQCIFVLRNAAYTGPTGTPC